MSHEIGRIPIQTMCGMLCISEILPDLPLPSYIPKKCTPKQHSLLHYPETVKVAENFLHQSFSAANGDKNTIDLLTLLADALVTTCSDDLVLTDEKEAPSELLEPSCVTEAATQAVDICELPPIFNQALCLGAIELSTKNAFQCFINSLGDTKWPPPKLQSGGDSTIFQDIHNFQNFEMSGNHKRKHKKKHKSKKKKDHKSLVNCSDISPRHKESSHDNVPLPHIPTLKISFRHPSGPVIVTTSQSNSDYNHISKKKKKKKREKSHKPKDETLDYLQAIYEAESQPTDDPSNHLINNIESNDAKISIEMPANAIEPTENVHMELKSDDRISSPFLDGDPFIDLLPMSHLQQSRECGLFDHIFSSSHQDGFSNAPEVDVELSNMHDFLNFDLHCMSDISKMAPLNADKDSQESHRVGSLLSVATSSRGGSEFGQGRGKPDSFQSHINSGSIGKQKEKCSKNKPAVVTQRHDDPARRHSRVKRRRNELDNLTSWSLKYDNQEEGDVEVTQETKPDAMKLYKSERGTARNQRQARRVTYVCDSDDESQIVHDSDSSNNYGLEEDNADVVMHEINKSNGEGFVESRHFEGTRKKKDDDEEFVVRMKESKEAYPLGPKNPNKSCRNKAAYDFENPSFKPDSLNSVSKELCLNSIASRWNDYLNNVQVDLTYYLLQLSSQIRDAMTCSNSFSFNISIIANSFEQTRFSLHDITKISQDVAKLKHFGITKEISLDVLHKLLQLLHLNLMEGLCLQIASKGGTVQQLTGHEQERIHVSVEAAICALNIMTSPDIYKEVFIEDIMEQSIFLLRSLLLFNIYPQFDSAYNLDESLKDIPSSIKAQRAKDHFRQKSNVLMSLYARLVDLVSCFADLVPLQGLTDNLVLQLSAISTSAVYVENVYELQMRAVRLATNIFPRYEQHRRLIMEDLISSLHKLPSSKKNLKAFKLNSEESIQVFSVLILMLVQSVVQLPSNIGCSTTKSSNIQDDNKGELIVASSYALSMKIAYSFLHHLLFKCTQKQSEANLQNVLENFVADLLLTVNKPEWPAAEMLLSLMGSLLVKQFNNKQLDQGIRVASISYLGTVASTLRKDAIANQLKDRDIDQLISSLKNDDTDGDDTMELVARHYKEECQFSRMQKLSNALICYLRVDSNSVIRHSRIFFLAQWLSDCEKVVEAQCKQLSVDSTSTLIESVTKWKQLLLTLMIEEITEGDQTSKTLKYRQLDYEEACLVCRYLASLRPLSQSFDLYLAQICKLLNENSVIVRTRAMRCLSAVVEVDPTVLGRKDVERSVHSRFLDTSISVREAAIELVGKYCITQPALVAQYYPLLADRILDTGVSVRKRVIKIFRDICIEHPEFENVTDICVKMIRRANDEEGIQKLVNEVFQHLWFTPVKERENIKVLQKVVTITDVVSCGQETSNEWFLQFLKTLLNQQENEKVKSVEKACRQIVDSLVINILRLEEISNKNNSRLVACLSTLHLFTRALPELMVQYAQTLFPYLQIKCNETIDSQIIHHTSRILEIIVPLMDSPDSKFLEELEKTLFDLMLRHGKLVLESCVACFSAVVNKCSHNHTSVRQLFNRLYNGLISFRKGIEANPERRPDPLHRPNIMRFVFIIGLLCKYFAFDSIRIDQPQQDDLFNTLLFYAIKVNDPDIHHKSLSSIGFLCIRNNKLLCGRRLRDFYHTVLTSLDSPVSVNTNVAKILGFLKPTADIKCQVMENLSEFLQEDEKKIMAAESLWSEKRQQESLKETDPTCSVASQVSQYYYQPVLHCFLHPESQVRFAALSLVVTILKQGLINPVPLIPYLIALETDSENQIRVKADIQLQEIDKKYPCFVNIRACEGVLLSHKLQLSLCSQPMRETDIVRGVRHPPGESPLAMNHHVYALLRNNRSMRHALINNILKRFEETQLLAKAARSQSELATSVLHEAAVNATKEIPHLKAVESFKGVESVSLGELVYLADNLAYFPYQFLEEPLFIIHRCDLIVSLAGHNILTTVRDALFAECMQSNANAAAGIVAGSCVRTAVRPSIVVHEEEMTYPTLMTLLGFSTSTSQISSENSSTDASNSNEFLRKRSIFIECTEASRACLLLLMLKQFLKDLYCLNEEKIQRFVPNENVKLWEKPVTRKSNSSAFNPSHILQLLLRKQDITQNNFHTVLSHPEQVQLFHGLVNEFVEFHKVILTIDPEPEVANKPIPLPSGSLVEKEKEMPNSGKSRSSEIISIAKIAEKPSVKKVSKVKSRGENKSRSDHKRPRESTSKHDTPMSEDCKASRTKRIKRKVKYCASSNEGSDSDVYIIE